MSELLAALMGFAGGLVGGLLGVGGGILFVPALTIFMDNGQVGAEATSLLAIIPVALVATWRQSSYGNLRLKEGLLIGVLSPIGVGIGVVVANSVPERALKLAFAALLLFVAFRMVRRAFRPEPAGETG
ncbi:MAG: sulfite exporter TauE/SafE family protein [Solirubrobacterales bacterium]|nr:sulfite exporter TauE/SafE family protein [Solirubrobacterales bacterium]